MLEGLRLNILTCICYYTKQIANYAVLVDYVWYISVSTSLYILKSSKNRFTSNLNIFKQAFQHEINHSRLRDAVTFIKYLARAVCFMFLANIFNFNDAFPVSSSLNLPKLVVDEVKWTFSVHI